MELLKMVLADAGKQVGKVARERAEIIITGIVSQPKLTTFLTNDNKVITEDKYNALATSGENPKRIDKSSVFFKVVTRDKGVRSESFEVSKIVANNRIKNPQESYGDVVAFVTFKEFVRTNEPADGDSWKQGDKSASLDFIEINESATKSYRLAQQGVIVHA